MQGFEKHDGGAWNHIRLGGSSMLADQARNNSPENKSYKGNYTGDHTIDEFYAWATAGGNSETLWMAGRYYKPTSGAGTGGGGVASQGRFTSAALTAMLPYAPRVLAPPTTGSGGGSMTAAPPTLRVLGMSWTWYGEPTDHYLTPLANWDGRRVLYDHSGNGGNGGGEGMPQADLEPKCGAGIDDGGQVYGPFYEDGFSPILDTKGRTPSVQDPTKLKYFVQFEIQGGGRPILLATPVVDDVTLFWDDNQSHLLSYVFDNRSF
jgi:hypothetical protein